MILKDSQCMCTVTQLFFLKLHQLPTQKFSTIIIDHDLTSGTLSSSKLHQHDFLRACFQVQQCNSS